MSSIAAVAEGATRQGEIASKVGIDSSAAGRYLNQLSRLHVLEHRYPLGRSGRRGVWQIADLNRPDFGGGSIRPESTTTCTPGMLASRLSVCRSSGRMAAPDGSETIWLSVPSKSETTSSGHHNIG